MREPIYVLDVRVDDVTFDTACAMVEAWIDDGDARQVATVNPEFVVRARDDVEFARALRGSALNVPDGVGVLWAARRQHRPLRQRVGGADLMLELCRMAARRRWRVFFLGAADGVAERTAALLAARFPGMMVAGTFAGSPRAEDDDGIVARIQRARPQLLFVAYGAPAQELWLARNLSQLSPADAPGMVAMGVGGAFDFVAGVRPRAPAWVQRIGLEWLFRLIREPRRWRRQLALPRFVWLVGLDSLAQRRHGPGAPTREENARQ